MKLSQRRTTEDRFMSIANHDDSVSHEMFTIKRLKYLSGGTLHEADFHKIHGLSNGI